MDVIFQGQNNDEIVLARSEKERKFGYQVLAGGAIACGVIMLPMMLVPGWRGDAASLAPFVLAAIVLGAAFAAYQARRAELTLHLPQSTYTSVGGLNPKVREHSGPMRDIEAIVFVARTLQGRAQEMFSMRVEWNDPARPALPLGEIDSEAVAYLEKELRSHAGVKVRREE